MRKIKFLKKKNGKKYFYEFMIKNCFKQKTHEEQKQSYAFGADKDLFLGLLAIKIHFLPKKTGLNWV